MNFVQGIKEVTNRSQRESHRKDGAKNTGRRKS